MANTSIQLKKSGATGNTPVSLQHGEVAINYADGKLYYKDGLNVIKYITNQFTFGSINSNGDLILALTSDDVLTINPGFGQTITSNVTNRSITFSVNESQLTSYAHANAAFDKANNAVVSVSGATGTVSNNQILSGLQTVSSTANITFDYIATVNNGNGTNVKIGDDAWIGDINIDNGFGIRGQQDASQGYIVFGNNDNNSKLGRSGSGPLTYGGNTIWHAGNDGASSGLDADLLDGQHASYFASAANTLAAGSYANAAFIQANTATEYAQSAGNYANSAFGKANTANVTYTVSGTAPSTPKLGDLWYNSSDDIKYEYSTDGTSYFWWDTESAAFSSSTSDGTDSFARNTANAAYIQANTATAYATSAGNYANAAFAKANTSVTTLATLTDVSLSGPPTANNYLKYNGTYWVNSNIPSYLPITKRDTTTASINVAQGYVSVLTRGGTTTSVPTY